MSKKRVFVINGSGGVGKDTFIGLVMLHYPARVISSVDEIKKAAEMLGWTGTKTEKDRKFLSDLKKLSEAYNDYPFTCMVDKVADWEEENIGDFLFIQIRERENIERAVREFGAKTILVTNPRVGQIFSNSSDGHVLEYDYDIHIVNDGSMEDLEKKALDFIREWGY